MNYDTITSLPWTEITHGPTFNTTTNQFSATPVPHPNHSAQSIKGYMVSALSFLRQLRNQTVLPPLPDNLQPNSEDESDYFRKLHDKLSSIHSLFTDVLKLPLHPVQHGKLTPSLQFQQLTRNPLFSMFDQIIFSTRNPIKTSGWLNCHSSANDIYEINTLTTILQLIYHILQVALKIVQVYAPYQSSPPTPPPQHLKYIKANEELASIYTSFIFNLLRWFSTDFTQFSKSVRNFAPLYQNVDKPLLFALLVYTDQDQHQIMLNILHLLLTFQSPQYINTALQSSQKSANDASFDADSSTESPFEYNPTLLAKLFTTASLPTNLLNITTGNFDPQRPPNELTHLSSLPSTSIADWFPVAIVCPQELRQYLNITADLQLTSHLAPPKTKLQPNPEPRSDLPSITSSLASLRVNLSSLRKQFIAQTLSQYNQLNNARKRDDLDLDDHSIDCLCHCTTYNHEIITPASDDELDDYHIAQYCIPSDEKGNKMRLPKTVSISTQTDDSALDLMILRDSYSEHEGMYNVLTLDFKSLLSKRETMERLPKDWVFINQSLFKLSPEYAQMVVDAYNQWNISEAAQHTSTSATSSQFQPLATKTAALYCSFGDCCGVDTHNEYCLFFIPENISISNSISIADIIDVFSPTQTLSDLVTSISTHTIPYSQPPTQLANNTCGHWPIVDSAFFTRIHPDAYSHYFSNRRKQQLQDDSQQQHRQKEQKVAPNLHPRINNVIHESDDDYSENDGSADPEHLIEPLIQHFSHLPQQDQSKPLLSCSQCLHSLPYIIIQYSALPYYLQFTSQETSTAQTDRKVTKTTHHHLWFSTHVYSTDDFYAMNEIKVEVDKSFIAKTAEHFVISILTQLILTFPFVLHPITQDELYAALTPSTFLNTSTQPFHANHNPAMSSIFFYLTIIINLTQIKSNNAYRSHPKAAFISTFLDSKILRFSALYTKILFFYSEILTFSIDAHKDYFKAQIQPSSPNHFTPQLQNLFAPVLDLWYCYTLLWSKTQLDLTAIHRFSPIQSTPPAVMSSNTPTTPSPLQIPKTTTTCSTISITPSLFIQPLLYTVSTVFQLINPLFPDWNEFQSNLEQWNKIKRTAFSMGNVDAPKLPKLDRKAAWIKIMLAPLANPSMHAGFETLFHNLSPYFAFLDPTLFHSAAIPTYTPSTTKTTPQEINALVNLFDKLSTEPPRSPDSASDIPHFVTQLQSSNHILFNKDNLHTAFQQCQTKPAQIISAPGVTHFSQMYSMLINALQSAHLLDTIFTPGDGHELLGEDERATLQTQNLAQPPPSVGTYQQNDLINQRNNAVGQGKQLMKKQFNITHSPRLFKTTVLTVVANLLCCIPSGATADYRQLLKQKNKSERVQEQLQLDELTLYDINTLSGPLGVLESILPLLVVDEHNPVCREWAILIMKMLTTKVTSILGGNISIDGDQDVAGSKLEENTKGNSLARDIEVVDEADTNQTQSTTTTDAAIDDDTGLTDNQLRLTHISESSRMVNENLKTQAGDLFPAGQLDPSSGQPVMSMNNPEHDAQVALRDEILNTPGVRIMTGWEPADLDEQYKSTTPNDGHPM